MNDFWQWWGDNSWAAWATGGVLLAAAELVSLDLVLLMLASGAFAGAIGDGLGAPLAVNIGLAVVVAVSMLGLVRPPMMRKLHRGAHLEDGARALVGTDAVVTTAVSRDGGQVRMHGEIWTARSYDETAVLEPGTRVQVFEIDGATAVVYPHDM
ncbi:MAG: NfeD family protein [Nocardioidaceae bacterium]|nr:NfeD family protein [Nocardioidaceae bacterium]